MNFESILGEKPVVLHVGSHEVELNHRNLAFNEANLSKFIQEIAVWYNYFGGKLADSEAILQVREHEYDVKYSEAYSKFKESGYTEKQSEAAAKSDPDVISCKNDMIKAKYNVRALQQHLRSWDKAHDASQNMGHTLRKEMDKLNADIRRPSDLETRLENILGE